MRKEVTDFQQAAAVRGIQRWNIHNCSMCGYACGFVIRGDVVTYDSGCGCTWGGEHSSSWEELAEHYNRNVGRVDAEAHCEKYPRFRDTIQKANEMWGFEQPEFLSPIAEQTQIAEAAA